MSEYVNSKLPDSTTHFLPVELLNMTGDQYSVARAMGVLAYREVQRSLREAKACACVRCTIHTWQRAQAQIAKLANGAATNSHYPPVVEPCNGKV